jgi:hypothetical protein
MYRVYRDKKTEGRKSNQAESTQRNQGTAFIHTKPASQPASQPASSAQLALLTLIPFQHVRISVRHFPPYAHTYRRRRHGHRRTPAPPSNTHHPPTYLCATSDYFRGLTSHRQAGRAGNVVKTRHGSLCSCATTAAAVPSYPTSTRTRTASLQQWARQPCRTTDAPPASTASVASDCHTRPAYAPVLGDAAASIWVRLERRPGAVSFMRLAEPLIGARSNR